jgi:hypothetical protein
MPTSYARAFGPSSVVPLKRSRWRMHGFAGFAA